MPKIIISITIILSFIVIPERLSSQNRNDSINGQSRHELNEIVITGTRNETDIRHLPMTISVLNRNQIDKSQEQSLLPILSEQIPGFYSTSRGILGYGVSRGAAGGMTIRGIGTGGSSLLVLIDGHPQYMGLMGHPISDAYQTMLAERVEVLRGPASVLYGSNAMGGVVNIVTRQQKEDGIKSNIRVAGGSYGTILTEGTNRIRKGKFNSIVTASYNRTDGHRANMDFEQYGGYAKLGYDFSDTWKAFADVNVTHFNAINPGTVTTPMFDNYSHITRGMTSFSIENNYEKTSGALKLFYNWGRHEINDGYSQGQNPREYLFNSKDLMMGITWYQSASLFEGNRITAGIDFQHFGGDAWNQYPDRRNQLVDKTENEVAGYISFRQAIIEKLTLDIGMRIDHHSRSGTEWIPQGGLAMQLPRSAELKAMVSKGFRNPTIREMFMFGSANPELRPERLMNYELSYSQRLFNDTFSYGLNVFYINGDNVIQTIQNKNINTGKIENWGTEVQTAYRINPSWHVSANYSWLRMVHPVEGAPQHKLYAGTDYTYGKWNIGTGLQYINGLYTNAPKRTTENFVLWNVRGSYRLHRIAELFIRGENLLAQHYEINAGYPMPKATVIGGINLHF